MIIPLRAAQMVHTLRFNLCDTLGTAHRQLFLFSLLIIAAARSRNMTAKSGFIFGQFSGGF